jgi:hypothetical protein
MVRRAFFTDLAKLGGIVGLSGLGDVVGGGAKKMRVWAMGFKGQDDSLHIGCFNEQDEELYITYRPVKLPYDEFKKHFKKNPKNKWSPKNHQEAARSHSLVEELTKDMRVNLSRYRATGKDTNFDVRSYYSRMADWCERMASQFRSLL